MLASNHRRPKLSYSARLPWRRRRHLLAPYVGGYNVLCVYHDGDGSWWSDGNAVFRGTVPAYLRRAYLDAGMPAESTVTRLPFTPIEALALLGPRLDEPIATYRIDSDVGSHGSIPVDVFATRNPADPEVHVDARYVAHALHQFERCSFWLLDDLGIAMRDPQGFLIVGYVQRRPLPPSDVHHTGVAL